jgi:hypothetical protein
MAATDGEIENNSSAEQYLIYKEAEELKRKNDLIYIQSIDNFKDGIKKYFKDYGKTTIPEEDLYIEDDRRSVRQQSDSYFLYEYLAKWAPRAGNLVKEKDTLMFISKPRCFETFRAAEILDYPFQNENIKKTLVPMLEDYYRKELPKTNFVNCQWSQDGRYWYRPKEARLGQIFRKFQFETPVEFLIEFIWLDNDGSRIFESSGSNRSDSISQMLLERLNSNDLAKLRQQIIKNMRTGIKLESVLGTHIAWCKKLQIKEATDLIFDAIGSSENDGTLRVDATDIYLELGGEAGSIAGILIGWKSYDDYYFLHLLTTLTDTYPELIIEMGIKALNDPATSEERKIQIAETLTEAGSWDGFAYMVEDLRKNKFVSKHIGRGRSIKKIDTKKALQEIEDIVYLIIDDRYNDPRSFHDTARHLILDWIYQLAAKSENDLMEVAEFLEKMKDKLVSGNPNAIDMNWYINRIFENFRGSDKTIKSITEIKNILQGMPI